MKVYVVNVVCDEEYGNSEVVAVYSRPELAQDYVAEHQYQWHPWWKADGETLDAFTIDEWEVDGEPLSF